MKKIFGLIIVWMLIILLSIQVLGFDSGLESLSIDDNTTDYYFDVGIGEPTNIHEGDIFPLGENELFVTLKNSGEIPAYVEVDFLLEFNGEYGWEEIASGVDGPYDLDPDAWIESFFDVFFDLEGEYRATFSLDTPLRKVGSDWHDENPDNDTYIIDVKAGNWITATEAFATCPVNALYFNDKELFPIPPLFYGLPTSIIIGGITVEATVLNATYPFSYVEFYAVNMNWDNQSHIDNTSPYQWEWDGTPGLYFIGVIAKTDYDVGLDGDIVVAIKI
jgi:hypothetical protein